MGRGVLSGIVFGVLVTILGLGAVSLMLPAPKLSPPISAAPGDAAPDVDQSVPRVATPALPDPAPPRPVDAPSDDNADRVAAAPDASTAPGIVEIPAGSEFARGAEDIPPAPPAEQPAPQATTEAAPEVLRPEDAPAPVQTDTQPAARPGAPGASPEPQDLPQTESAALAEPPQAETPVPVPPPGEVKTPALSPVPSPAAPATEGQMPQAEVAPAPEEEREADAVPEAAPAPEEELEPGAVPEVARAPEPEPEPATIPDAAPAAPPRGQTAETGVPAAGAGVAARRQSAALPQAPLVPNSEAGPAQPAPEAPSETIVETVPTDEPMAPEADAAPSDPVEADMAPEMPRVFSPSSPAAPAGRPAGFSNAPGVRVGRLPTIGADAAPAEAAPSDLPEGMGEAEEAGPLPALRAYAQPFDRPADKALYSVVLIDTGTAAGGLDRATLKTLGVPVTIAIDPRRADATEAAADFRAAGFEVAILAAPLAATATPADLEVTIESWRKTVPEAIALVEGDAPTFQNNRRLAQDVVRILAREGMGLISQDRGLNAAAQIAQSAEVPQARVWRVLDSGRDKSSAIERMLGRAAFEATRNDKVTVMLSGWPESVAGLIAWAPSLPSDSAFAPVSAVILENAAGN